MGILDSMTQQSQPQTTEQSTVENPQGSQQQGSMAQMYQMLMQNSLNAIANTAEEKIQQKGPEKGIAELIASAMTANLKSAQQNSKTIPPQVMIQVAKDLATQLLQHMGASEEQIDDLLFDILMDAFEIFGEMTHGALPPEEERQYVGMIRKISELEQQRTQAKEANKTSNLPQNNEQVGVM
ncbi:TPA: hypothetical protein ACSJ9Y_001604 [Haemophilus influenzae]|uniref:hypothetical protein n=1 Tax=Haemophilus influenzae TaxID=727 RepID=UPI001F45F927|nr:hypothetical protein [Haemophilus influenzae]